MGTLHLVRHGQASFLAEDYDRLSDLGRRQAACLGDWLRRTGRAAGAVVCGGMRRHAETAEACLAAWGVTPAEGERCDDPAFAEFDHMDVLCARWPEFRAPGRLAERLRAEADPHRAFQRLFAESLERWTGGAQDSDYAESWVGFRARCVAGLERVVAATPPSGSAWVFTSGGPVAALCQHALGLSDARTLDLNAVIANTAVTTLRHGRGRLGLVAFNGVAHLEAGGEPGLLTHR